MSLLANPPPIRSAGEKTATRVFSCLDDMLAHYGAEAPDRNAILSPNCDPLTYGELRFRVSKAVRELRELGIGPTDRVAVVLPNGAATAVALVSVATAAGCVPLNSNLTADELQRYLADFNVAALLTRADMNSAARTVAQGSGIPVIDLSPCPGAAPWMFDLIGSGTPRAPSRAPACGAGHDALVLMTSGTTARPKIVPLTQAGVCASAYNAGAALRLRPEDRLLNMLPLFHAHGLISGLLTALAAGSTVVCTPGFDPAAFFGWLDEFRPSWYTAVPSVHRALLSEAVRRKLRVLKSSLRVVRSASASLPVTVLRDLERLFGVPVIETYGMTEAASQIAANTLELRKPGSVGKSAGAEIAIIDDEGRKLATGKRGEIVLRGPAITRGYDNDIAATQSAFRDGWFRTGDLGYLDRDGYLFIVGRIKDVIKRGGQQVAPAEVEAAFLAHPDVIEAVAFSVPHERLGEDVAAAIVLGPDARISEQALRKFASERLASYKVPGLIRFVDAIPKNAAGKVKREGLGAMLFGATPTTEAKAESTAPAPAKLLERQLAEIWADQLEVDRVGVDQDVFALGADSITVTQMRSRLRRQFGVDFSFKDMFDAPTAAMLAARIEQAEAAPSGIPLSPEDPPADASGVRMSFPQQRMHVLHRLDPTGYNYLILEVVRLTGRLDVGALEASIASICERHQVLRSTFVERAGEPLQIVGTAQPRLERLDMRPCPKSKRAAAVQQRALALLRQPLDIETQPLLRAQLLQLDEDDHALVVQFHHLINDGWSQRLFWKEIEALYEAHLTNSPSALPALAAQYRDFVEWQRAWLETPAAADQVAYWRSQLEGVTALPLRTDRPRPDTQTGRGARHPLRFSPELSRALKSLSRDHRVTLFMTLLAAFQCLLHRHTRHDDVAVGSVIANRNQVQFEPLLGMFANTIVLRTNLSGDPSFGDVLSRVRQLTLDAYRNQDVPFEEVLRTLQVSRSADRNTLFQVMFLMQNPPPITPELQGLSTHLINVDPGIARVDLLLELMEADGGLSGWLEYGTELFDADTITRLATHLQTLLQGIVANPEAHISQLPLVPAAERRRVISDWNDTDKPLPARSTLPERFFKQAERTPEAIAVSAGRARLDYRTLARRVSAIAARLSAEGVGPDVVVVLMAERSADLLAAMIAVQTAGGAFLSLDPKLPAARQTQIIQHSRTPLILAGRGCSSLLKTALAAQPLASRPKILSLAKLIEARPRKPISPARGSASDLAYVIYTSGSTGVPKGAMVEQRGLRNHLLSKISELELSASDVIAQTAPQTFDISVWQFLAGTMVGARVHVCANEVVRDPALLMREIDREGVTVLQIVPSLLRAILDRMPDEPTYRALSRLRSLTCIGEALTPDLCREWLRHFPGVPLINAYGPAECADTVSTYRVTAPAPLTTVPIGRAIANTRLYVVDAHLQPMPIGVAGELCVGGDGVGRGYLNDPEQTKQRFLRDPFSRQPDARLYRTGDLARWRADGTLEFLGRVDHQVKIRGYRIELEEIERVLEQLPAINAAVVLARNAVGDGTQIIAHVVAHGPRPDVKSLRDFLKGRLPEYMVPARFIHLDRIPLTAHGKVDRSALRRTRGELEMAGGDFVAPRNATEETLAGILSDLLKVKTIGAFDNFFELGGHSLLAGRALARIADSFGVSLSLRAFFEAPTVAALALRVEDSRKAQTAKPAPAIALVNRTGPQPVSLMQEQVLKIERALPGLPQFNLPFAFRLQGPLNARALEQAFAEAARRHDSLRSAFVWKKGRPVVQIGPAADARLPFAVKNLAARAAAGKRGKALLLKKAELIAEEEAWLPFDVSRAPLIRLRLLRLAPDDHVLILIVHHVVVDGWSIGILMEEVSAVYAALTSGRQAQLPKPELQFSEFAHWQRLWCAHDAAAEQLGYWKQHLQGASPLFPTDGDTEGVLLSSPVVHQPLLVPNDLAARLNAFSQSHGCTLFMTLLTGFKSLLLARTGRNDICVATAMANRSQLRTERVVGPLMNITLTRTRVGPDLSFADALGRVRESVVDAYARQELPFDVLTAQLAKDGELDPASLIQAFFVLQNASQPLNLPNVTVRSFAYPDGQRALPIDRTWLSVMLKESPAGIVGSCSFKSDLFEAKAAARWVKDYTAILTRAIADPETPLGRLGDC
ncbi:non-ribosomal peptide synthetase [Rhodoplanes sp. Z2-YC6860]|uniref:non-ribosomal peptide synthetase n=1 Tax=Rhodoplanes sp. Z2-YC6860 TaxID=674703 RepID=UPI00078EA8C2|nr:non-ribosomal peptide synthetase [Rhodoplanes sp. Z2-YC6860]AMN39127.1 amino acid adenylation enzyme/thioester reductase family protein [Rhodoplanes sp. Z2-YC6860]